jgi:hypothetical protein
MRKGIVIGLGAALATFAVNITDADASCRRRHNRPPPVYGYAPPPPPVNGCTPPAAVYGYGPPAGCCGNGSATVGYYYPPTAYGPGQPYAYGPSYYGPPPPAYGSYPPPPGPPVGYQGSGYAPPYYGAYRPDGVWVQIR